mgnify:CR=1 FL=1
MKEDPDQVNPIRINYIQYFLAIPVIFRENRKFMFMVIGFTFIMISQVTIAYYALYAVCVFDAGAYEIGLLVAITSLVNILGNIAFGIMADKYSHRLIVVISSVLGAVAGFLVIGIPYMWAVYVAYALTNLCLSGYNLSGGILIIENVQKEKLPMRISINSMITLVVSSVVTVGSSFLVDQISFSSVFIIAGIAGIIGSFILYPYNKSSI